MKRLIRYIRAKMLGVPFRERVWYNYSAMLKKAERKSPNVTHVVIFDDNGNYIDCPPIGGEVTYSIKGELYKYKVVGFKNESRYEIAKSAMNAMLANPELLQVVTSKEYVVGTFCQNRVAKVSVDYADALIAELKIGDDREEDPQGR